MAGKNTPEAKARDFLKKDLIIHIGAFLTVIVCIFALMIFAVTVSAVVYNAVIESYIVYNLILLIFSLFAAVMGFSLVAGLLVFEFNCARGEKPDIRDIFYPFSSARVLFRLWYLLIELGWRAVLYFAPALLCTYLFGEYAAGRLDIFESFTFLDFDLNYTLLCVLSIVLFILASIHYAKYFTAVYLALDRENMPIHLCFFAARIYNYYSNPSYTSVMTSFIPLIAISIFTFGAAFVYVIPLIVLSCFCTARDICTNHTALQVKLDIVSDGTYFGGFDNEAFDSFDENVNETDNN